MRIVVMMSVYLMLMTGLARGQQVNAPADPFAAANTDRGSGSLLNLASVDLRLAPEQAPQTGVRQPATPPPTVRPGARRRGSMVGYIDDATIESKIRVRFDTASENTVPDRAEFFYAKCGCYRDLAGTALFDPDSPGPGPGIVTDLNFQQIDVWGEYAINRMFSVFAQLPLRWVQPQTIDMSVAPAGSTPFGDESGIGDIRAGVKVGFEPAVNHTLTAQAQFFFPTGDALKGLGTDHSSIEPGVLYNWQASDMVVVEGQFKLWLPFGGSAGPTASDEDFSGRVLTWGVGSGVNLLQRGDIQLGPVVELVGWRVLSGFQTPPSDASDTNIVNLKIGGRLTFDGSNSVYVGYGKALTDAMWYDDIWRFEYRFSF